MECLWGIFLSMILPLLLFRLNNISGLILSCLLVVVGFCITYETGAELVQINAVLLPVIIGQTILILNYGKTDKRRRRNGNDHDIMRVELLDDRMKKHYIGDLNRGVAVFGSSGAGKSASVIYFLMKHLASNKFSGIINDYKDYELSEIAYPLFREHDVDFRIFAIHDVNRSVRINVIDPRYIETMSDVTGDRKSVV